MTSAHEDSVYQFDAVQGHDVLTEEGKAALALGLAWAAAEAALPEGFALMVGHTDECRFCAGWWATASKRLEEPPHYPKIISSEDGRPRGEHHDSTPASALDALARALRLYSARAVPVSVPVRDVDSPDRERESGR